MLLYLPGLTGVSTLCPVTHRLTGSNHRKKHTLAQIGGAHVADFQVHYLVGLSRPGHFDLEKVAAERHATLFERDGREFFSNHAAAKGQIFFHG